MLLPEAVVLSTTRTFGIVTSVVSGRGRRLMLGHLEGEAQEAVELAISWVCANAGRLKSWGGAPVQGEGREARAAGSGSGRGGGRHSTLVHSASEDVVVRVSEIDAPKHGLSLGACAALSVVQWLWRHRAYLPDVGVTGAVDLRGRLLRIGGVEEKAREAARTAVRTLVLPQELFEEYSRDDFAQMPADLRDYARGAFRGAASMLDVLGHAFEGRWRGWCSGWRPGRQSATMHGQDMGGPLAAAG